MSLRMQLFSWANYLKQFIPPDIQIPLTLCIFVILFPCSAFFIELFEFCDVERVLIGSTNDPCKLATNCEVKVYPWYVVY